MSCLDTPWSVLGIVSKAETAWKEFNRHYRAQAHSCFSRELVYAGENPIRYCLYLIVFYFELLFLAGLFPEDCCSVLLKNDFDIPAYFSALWAVQATLVALVYPFVISFVTVFLQKRPFANGFVHLYMVDSGALIAGLSSLSLLAVMAVQYFLMWSYGEERLLVWTVLDSVWFIGNISITTYFLFRTVLFLRPETHKEAIQGYVINVALPRVVRTQFSAQVLLNIQNEKWFQVPGYDAELEGPSVSVHSFFMSEGKAQGRLEFKASHRLANVRLRLFRLAVLSWYENAKRFPRPQRDAHPKGRWPMLTLPYRIGAEYPLTTPLAFVSAGPNLSWLERLLLKTSLVFKPTKNERLSVSLASILLDLEGNAAQAILSPGDATFKAAYFDLIEVHELLLYASLFRDTDGSIQSWAVLPSFDDMFNGSLYRAWTNSYRSIIEAAVAHLLVDAMPFWRLCNLATHIDEEVLRQSPVEISIELMDMQMHLMHELSMWWAGKVEEQGSVNHSHAHMVTLKQPQKKVYDDAVARFVSGLERLRDTIIVVPEVSAPSKWGENSRYVALNTAHIFHTGKLLLLAVLRGDTVAAEWLADSLDKWFSTLVNAAYEPFEFYNKVDFVTVDDLTLDWDAFVEKFSIQQFENGVGTSVDMLKRGALVAALKNYWLDIRILVLETLLSWGSEPEPEPENPFTPVILYKTNSSLALKMANGMLQGHQWHGGGEVTDSFSNFSASQYLTAKARQFASRNGSRDSYYARLSNFVTRVSDYRQETMLTSRIYSWSGHRDISSLTVPQVQLLVYWSSGKWSLDVQLKQQVALWLNASGRHIDRLQQLIHTLVEAFNQEVPFNPELPPIAEKVGSVAEALSKRAQANEAWKAKFDIAKACIAESSKYIDDARNNLLIDAEISQAKLRQLGIYASKLAFTKEPKLVPLCFFVPNIEYKNESGADEFTMTMNDVSKGQLTDVAAEPLPINMEEFWSDAALKSLRRIAIRDALDKLKITDVVIPNAQEFWAFLKSEAKGIVADGHTPVLLLGSLTKPDWILGWLGRGYENTVEKPEDLVVTKKNIDSTNYLGNFNDIEIYVAPIGQDESYLVTREDFLRIEYQEFEPGRFVDVSAEVDEKTPLLVALKLKFSRTIAMKDGVGYRLILSAGTAGALKAAPDSSAKKMERLKRRVRE